MKRYIHLLLTLLFFATSCETVLPIDDDGNHQMVLNAIPTADHQAFVNFAYTRFLLDSSNNHPVADAQLILSVNGIPYTPDSMRNCNYFFPYTLHPLDNLQIDIDAAGRHVHAATYVPPLPRVANPVAMRMNYYTFKYLGVNFTHSDSLNYNEYYRIVVTERDSGARYNEWTRTMDTVDTVGTCLFAIHNGELTDPAVCASVPLANYFYYDLLCRDDNINGRQHYPIQLLILQTIDTNEVQPFKHEYTVRIQSITPEYYQYIISASSQSSMFSFFAEQGQVFSNVDGALGIFAGASKWEYTFFADTLPDAPASALPLRPLSKPPLPNIHQRRLLWRK